MPTLQIKRGTTSAVTAYTPLAGELIMDTTTKYIYVGDGTTAGGVRVGSGGNADTATKLATARTFNIAGGATAAAQSFDGSANVTFTVTSLDATKLSGTASVNTTGSAAKLTTARTIALDGAITGTTTFDGAANKTITTTLSDIDLGVL